MRSPLRCPLRRKQLEEAYVPSLPLLVADSAMSLLEIEKMSSMFVLAIEQPGLARCNTSSNTKVGHIKNIKLRRNCVK